MTAELSWQSLALRHLVSAGYRHSVLLFPVWAVVIRCADCIPPRQDRQGWLTARVRVIVLRPWERGRGPTPLVRSPRPNTVGELPAALAHEGTGIRQPYWGRLRSQTRRKIVTHTHVPSRR